MPLERAIMLQVLVCTPSQCNNTSMMAAVKSLLHEDPPVVWIGRLHIMHVQAGAPAEQSDGSFWVPTL